MVGCAALIAGVAFIIAIIVAQGFAESSFTERLLGASAVAAMTFVAALLLLFRDYARHRAILRRVRRMLECRPDVQESEFLTRLPDCDPKLLVQTRQAVAEFFDVPPEKIHPADNLRSDLEFDALEPGFHSFVVFHVLAARNVPLQSFSFDTRDLSDLADLANEIKRVLDGPRQVNTDRNA